jgi:hypothetical protein
MLLREAMKPCFFASEVKRMPALPPLDPVKPSQAGGCNSL